MKKSLAIYIIVLVLGAMQAQAVNYKNTYGGAGGYRPVNGSYQATAPSVSFQSTSAYSGQLSAEGISLVNADGSVNTESYGVGRSNISARPRRVDANNDGYDDVTGLPVNPIVDPNDPGNVPIGDALIPLLILAAGYAVYRRRVVPTMGQKCRERRWIINRTEHRRDGGGR